VVNAWAYHDFRNAVLATGCRNLIMAGVTTEVCLIFPAIDEKGFTIHDAAIQLSAISARYHLKIYNAPGGSVRAAGGPA